jgi:serine/threonine-protein kinase
MLDAEAEAPIDPWVGPYVILAHLADGGMGRAYLGRRKGSAELVVVKIRREVEDTRFNAEIQRRFAREGEVHARLRNRNIAALVDAKPDYLVFEHVAGPSVGMLMGAVFRSHRSFPAPIMGRLLKGMLAGLHHLHEARGDDGERLLAVHRDVTPGNVLISLDGVVKIIDLGLVRAKAGGFRTEMKLVMGTAQYISPEVASASTKSPDRRADIYAASVIAYEMLVGEYLVAPGTHLSQVAAQLIQPNIPSLSSRGVLVSPEVEAVIMRGLSVKPGDRWGTAHEMSMALGDALGGSMVSEDEIAQLIGPSSHTIRDTRDHWQDVARRGLERELGGEVPPDMFEPTHGGVEPEQPLHTLVVRQRTSEPPPPVEISLESVLSGIEPPLPYERTEVVERRRSEEPSFDELTQVSIPRRPARREPGQLADDPALKPAAVGGSRRPERAGWSRGTIAAAWGATVVAAALLGASLRGPAAPDTTPQASPTAPAVTVVPARDPAVSAQPAPTPTPTPTPSPTAPPASATPRPRPTPSATASSAPSPTAVSPFASLIRRLDNGEPIDPLIGEALALSDLVAPARRAVFTAKVRRAEINADADLLREALLEVAPR